jgi:hypothetical protein
MNSDDLTPPMFAMEPPFPDMQIGKIRILHGTGETIGELIPYQFPEDRLFGARIDILGPPVYDSRANPLPTGRFATAGHFTVTILKLSQDLLEEIQQTPDRNIPYLLELE